MKIAESSGKAKGDESRLTRTEGLRRAGQGQSIGGEKI
jgi:hypothetical protein